MQVIPVTAVHRGFGKTSRRDTWWAAPLGVFVGLSAFLVYATWAAFQNAHYHYGPYLSPFYAPELWGDSPHAWFGPKPAWWPAVLPFSPALLILPFPGGFRFTCYYYRGAYYKAFWFTNPATGVTEFGIGVGTIVLTVNVCLLASYTWGCHVLRHVVGGWMNEVSKSPVCDKAYACVSSLNGRHQLFAWCSLFSVAFADIYIRLCSMGIFTDFRIL